ncbi:MAG TPA: PEP-CTERM sorting domain-containing protein [Vicinamibacterales bacterium]|nr:PEP-CTERM sorting domain-containing protein [Vicinamibacterales bacterium]
MRIALRATTIAILMLVLVAPAAGAGPILPGPWATVEGDYGNAYPFNLGGAFVPVTSLRYQQVYDSGAFAGQVVITGMSFRPDDTEFGGAFSTVLSDVQINMSTTTKAVDGLSNTFSENVGADDTIVFARGSLPLSSAFTGAGPKDFDIHIIFTQAFLYNPAIGNLLFDVRNFGGGFTTYFDAAYEEDDIVSRVTASDVNALFPGPDQRTDGNDSLGLITQFDTQDPDPRDISEVPEPGTCVLVGIGLAGVARRFRDRARRS